MSLGMNSVGLNQPYSRQIAMRANSEQTVQAQEQVQTEKTLTDSFTREHKKNGLVERAYNGVKNLTGLGTGSKKVKAVIAKAEKGEISEEEAQKTIDKYRKSQANSAQAFGDVLSIGSSGITFFALRNYLKKLGAEAVVNKENKKLFLCGIDKKSLWDSKGKAGMIATATAALIGGIVKYASLKFNRIDSDEFRVNKKDFNGAKTPQDKARYKIHKKLTIGKEWAFVVLLFLSC